MKLRTSIAAVALALISAPAFADDVKLTNVLGQWSNAITDQGANLVTLSPGQPSDPAKVQWGTPFAPNTMQSAYVFDAANAGLTLTVIPPGSSGIGILGTFTHENFPITPPTLQSIQLAVFTDIAVNQGGPDVPLGNFAFVFDFTHDETPNGGVPGGPFTGSCPYGGAQGAGVNINGCADRVTVSPVDDQTVFTIGSVQYTLTILGFSNDGCASTSSSFLTIENKTNSADICAQVTAVTRDIPEPGSLALVGLALLAAGFIRRKTIG